MRWQSITKNHASLTSMLTCLTLIFIGLQISLFITHYHVSELLDSLVKSSLILHTFSKKLFIPIFNFIFIQFFCYCIFILWIWFIANGVGKYFRWNHFSIYITGLFAWVLGCIFIVTLNKFFYPNSFFSQFLNKQSNLALLILSGTCLLTGTIIAYLNCFINKDNRFIAMLLFSFIGVFIIFSIIAHIQYRHIIPNTSNKQPNIILISIDSARPDFIHYLSKRPIATPAMDDFLKNAIIFTEAYTPLARTFPSWISILTGKDPKHSDARNNLTNPKWILRNTTLAQRLQAAGYETIYATDEKRFSNITKEYGFDQIIGPEMGINDFIIGGLGDFPLSNLLMNSALGKYLFPYNFANRAAAVTYNPDAFLQLIKMGLNNKTNKPLFLAIHFCLPHWPYIWGSSQLQKDATYLDLYSRSLIEIDKQFSKTINLLKRNHLLKNSIVLLLSDHGTTLGLPKDRNLSEKLYQGNLIDTQKILHFGYLTTNVKDKFHLKLDTSYGQGTDVLSLKQNHALLAIHIYNRKQISKVITSRVSLLDIAPTILTYLKLPPISKIDGISLFKQQPLRPFYFESGYNISEIDKGNIEPQKVIQRSINAYEINPSGLLFLNDAAQHSMVQEKQYAVLQGEWFLAYYPGRVLNALTLDQNHQLRLQPKTFPAYSVLVNLSNGKWTMDMRSKFAKESPRDKLAILLKQHYGNEIIN